MDDIVGGDFVLQGREVVVDISHDLVGIQLIRDGDVFKTLHPVWGCGTDRMNTLPRFRQPIEGRCDEYSLFGRHRRIHIALHSTKIEQNRQNEAKTVDKNAKRAKTKETAKERCWKADPEIRFPGPTHTPHAKTSGFFFGAKTMFLEHFTANGKAQTRTSM